MPSKTGLLLDVSVQNLEKIIYFAGYIITKIDEEARKKSIEEIEREYKQKLKSQNSKPSNLKNQLKEQRDRAVRELRDLHRFQILPELGYRDLSLKYAQVFEAGTGAETLRKIFEEMNLEELAKKLTARVKEASPVLQKKIQKNSGLEQQL